MLHRRQTQICGKDGKGWAKSTGTVMLSGDRFAVLVINNGKEDNESIHGALS
jgi:hypothetical protein